MHIQTHATNDFVSGFSEEYEKYPATNSENRWWDVKQLSNNQLFQLHLQLLKSTLKQFQKIDKEINK